MSTIKTIQGYYADDKMGVIQVMAQSTVVYSFLCSFLLLGTYFFICLGRFARTEKEISWLLTFASSSICTLLSSPYSYRFYRSGWDIQWINMDSTLHTALVCFFITYLIMDLSLGWMYYRRRITLVSGWIHHIVYIVILVWLMQRRATSFFTTHAILELPTVLLSIGSLYPSWRCDRLFAIVFFMLRIVYHVVVIYMLKSHHHQHHHRLAHLWLVALFILPLHLYWFHAIICSLLKKQKHKTQARSPISQHVH